MRGWFVLETHGNAYQSGFPDLYCAHREFRTRWVEVKNKDAYAFTNAQRIMFPQFAAAGVGIWVLTAATDSEYEKLWQPANWHMYLTSIKPGSSRRKAQVPEGTVIDTAALKARRNILFKPKD